MRRKLGGAALVAAAALGLAAPAPAAAWSSNWWHSPTGNIRCRYWPDIGGMPVMACMTRNDLFVAAVPLTGKAWKEPDAAPAWGRWPAGPALAYGDTFTVKRRFRCSMAKKGVTCRSLRSTHGFFLNRTHYRLF